MIVGTGVDIIEIARIAEAVSNRRFQARVYTELELGDSKLLAHRLAGFFAAKEALLKAMGTGLTGYNWQEMEVNHHLQGAPYLKVYGKVAAFLKQKKVTAIHLSISHCREYAIAQVIMEAKE